jgi:hypothetical protein
VTIRSKNWRGAKLVKEATKTTTFFSDRIRELVTYWNQCVEAEKDYAEK